MRILAGLILGLLVVGCGEIAEVAHKSLQPKKKTPSNNTAAKPAKKLTLKESVVGSYEGGVDVDGDSVKIVLLENGVLEFYVNDEKDLERERKWSIAGKELHTVAPSTGTIGVYRIETNGDLTIIARIKKDSKREEAPKGYQLTWKRIK